MAQVPSELSLPAAVLSILSQTNSLGVVTGQPVATGPIVSLLPLPNPINSIPPTILDTSGFSIVPEPSSSSTSSLTRTTSSPSQTPSSSRGNITSSSLSRTSSSASSSATAAAATEGPSSDTSLPASTKIALGVTIPIIVLLFLGIAIYFVMKRRSRNRNRRIENGGIIDGGVATSKHFPPEKDSDPIYEAEARNKRAELRAKKDTIAELEDTRPNPVHELEDGRR